MKRWIVIFLIALSISTLLVVLMASSLVPREQRLSYVFNTVLGIAVGWFGLWAFRPVMQKFKESRRRMAAMPGMKILCRYCNPWVLLCLYAPVALAFLAPHVWVEWKLFPIVPFWFAAMIINEQNLWAYLFSAAVGLGVVVGLSMMASLDKVTTAIACVLALFASVPGAAILWFCSGVEGIRG